MTAWLAAIQDTPTGQHVAMLLALGAALLHAVFGALQKGRHDPWLSRAAIDASYGTLSLPIALFLVPWPRPEIWALLAGAFFIHAAYKVLQAMAYQRGAYTVVYPVVRGSGPFFAVLGAMVVFRESFDMRQWAGLLTLVAGIFGLAAYNLRTLTVGRETLVPALGLAFATGALVATYTTYDAYGIRRAEDPFTFLAWFFVVDSLFMPVLTHRRWRALPSSEILPLLRRGITGALVAWASFGSIMLATRIGNVGETAVLRETSTVFSALIGWLFLKEKVGSKRLILLAMIAGGAALVEFGRG